MMRDAHELATRWVVVRAVPTFALAAFLVAGPEPGTMSEFGAALAMVLVLAGIGTLGYFFETLDRLVLWWETRGYRAE